MMTEEQLAKAREHLKRMREVPPAKASLVIPRYDDTYWEGVDAFEEEEKGL